MSYIVFIPKWGRYNPETQKAIDYLFTHRIELLPATSTTDTSLMQKIEEVANNDPLADRNGRGWEASIVAVVTPLAANSTHLVPVWVRLGPEDDDLEEAVRVKKETDDEDFGGRAF